MENYYMKYLLLFLSTIFLSFTLSGTARAETTVTTTLVNCSYEKSETPRSGLHQKTSQKLLIEQTANGDLSVEVSEHYLFSGYPDSFNARFDRLFNPQQLASSGFPGGETRFKMPKGACAIDASESDLIDCKSSPVDVTDDFSDSGKGSSTFTTQFSMTLSRVIEDDSRETSSKLWLNLRNGSGATAKEFFFQCYISPK
jgi:hypothetical protein